MSKILVIAAHPDDEVLGCGASMAKHTAMNDIVQVVFMADGMGSRQENKELVKQRYKASIRALQVLNCSEPRVLGFPDNQLDSVPLLKIVKKLEEVILSFKPCTIYTHHYGDLNIDHQITHRAVMTACRPQPHFGVKEIYSFEVVSSTYWQSQSMGYFFNPNYFIDVSKFIDLKIKALKCYEDEMREAPHARSYEAVRNLATWRGMSVGVQCAEAFCLERCVK